MNGVTNGRRVLFKRFFIKSFSFDQLRYGSGSRQNDIDPEKTIWIQAKRYGSRENDMDPGEKRLIFWQILI